MYKVELVESSDLYLIFASLCVLAGKSGFSG